MVATFIESFVEPTFLALIPALYWMLFQLRQFPADRITRIPPAPSTFWRKSTSVRSSSGGIGPAPQEESRCDGAGRRARPRLCCSARDFDCIGDQDRATRASHLGE